ncbi:MAG TPA: PQQ-dependent dehydrogenase, methanol/ethanol family [Gammaproteobacteria bacterium]|nr:PQQ-dependent dehydrogenase, methanol/ethanol family [Gammaproteobacteria bacterium]
MFKICSRGIIHSVLSIALLSLLAGCSQDQPPQTQTPESPPRQVQAMAPAAVDAARIVNADAEPGNWLTHGRTYSEQRYSPLDQINADNIGALGLAWSFDLDTNRGQESTPIVVDGRMFVTTAWSMVKALDAATGRLLWSHDPQVPRATGANACCDAVNRGAAVWGGRVYLGTLDGRLVALDVGAGKVAWEVVTVDQGKPYTITGAPRIINGKVIIGNGGAEFGVRGYVTAYDAGTGEQLWRFHTVPGNPADGFESAAMEMAAKTWNGEWWTQGGGGTVWDSMAYDPELDLLYIGVGNGSPWDRDIRSPGGGDNLFLSSIVALKAETGEYVWHYQTTPGENWDYTATQHIVLADIAIDGTPRKVLMQAPKNGYFYVIDRATGELISANAFINVNWASGIDMSTGRPIENPEARYRTAGKPWIAMPGPSGAHSWQPMSFSPLTGLVYIPVQEAGFVYSAIPDYKPNALGFNTGISMADASLPPDPAVRDQIIQGVVGHLATWDPVAQKEVWRVQHEEAWNGGILTTAGNLLIQGKGAGEFVIYRADNGERLWSTDAQSGVLAGPVSYTVNGEQYIAVAAGWGGIFGLAPGPISHKASQKRNISRVLAFKLNGSAVLPPAPPLPERVLNPPEQFADAATIQSGWGLYHGYCGACHGDSGVSSGLITDLRYSPMNLTTESWRAVVGAGSLNEKGMVSFAEVMDAAQIEAIRAYIVDRAQSYKAEMEDGQ